MKHEEYLKFINYIKNKGYVWLTGMLSHDENKREFEAVSVHTPCEKILPFKVDIIFNWNNLDEFENVNIEVISARFRSGMKLNTLPLGHHCAVKLKYEKWNPIFDLMMKGNPNLISIGLCEAENWNRIKKHITKTRKERLEE